MKMLLSLLVSALAIGCDKEYKPNKSDRYATGQNSAIVGTQHIAKGVTPCPELKGAVSEEVQHGQR